MLMALAYTFVILPSSGAQAADFRVFSQTVGDAYQLVDSNRDVLNRRRLHQYLGLGAYDLLSDGETHLTANLMLRFDADFGVSQRELDDVQSLQREQLSLQYGYVEGHNLAGFLDVRLGRQLHADALDFLMLDGAVIRFKTPWYFGVELQAGIEVKDSSSSFNASMFQTDGVRLFEKAADDDPTTIVIGAAIMTENLQFTRINIGYRRLFSDGEVDQEKAGGSISQRVVEGVHLSGTVSYDFYNQRFDRIQAGGRWQVTDYLDLEAEYVRLLPSFDADSIFNIFTAFPMNDGNARIRLHPSAQSEIYVGGMIRFFGNEGYTDGVVLATTDTVVQAYGAMAGYTQRFGANGRVHADVSWEAGYGGDRILGDIGGTWAIAPGEWELDGRVTAVSFKDEFQPQLEAVSVGYQLGGKYLIDTRAAVGVVAEHNFNKRQNNLRLMAVVDMNFWL
ncbi:MAG: hypothetical protein ACI9MR_003932 [Myxococcota bacterium]|jgi:hypothetical protein